MRRTFIDVFSGCGGLSLGLQMAGLQLVAAFDNNADAIATLNKNFGNKGHVIDVRELHLPRGAADVLVSGLPCQGFSTSGKMDENDPRNKLWKEFLRLVIEVDPKVVVVENVPLFLKSKEGKGLIEELEKLGYEVAADRLNAVDFGVPQKRLRVTIIGSLIGKPILPKGNSKKKTVRLALKGLPLGPDGKDDHQKREHIPLSLERFKYIPVGGNRFNLPKRLQSPCWQKTKKGFQNVFARIWWDKPSDTIRTNFLHPECGRYIHPSENRGLTIREGARLQSFPDSFNFEGTGLESKSRQIGNAVPPLLGKGIGKAIMKMFSECEEQLEYAVPLVETPLICHVPKQT